MRFGDFQKISKWKIFRFLCKCVLRLFLHFSCRSNLMLHPHFLNKKMNSFNNMFKAACGQLRPPYLRPRSFETCWFATHSFETCWVETRSYETTFMWDLFTWDHFHLGAVGWRRRSVETTFIWDLLSWDLFIGDHIHVRLVSPVIISTNTKRHFLLFLSFISQLKTETIVAMKETGRNTKHESLTWSNKMTFQMCCAPKPEVWRVFWLLWCAEVQVSPQTWKGVTSDLRQRSGR